MTKRLSVPVDDRFLRDVEPAELERRRRSAEHARARAIAAQERRPRPAVRDAMTGRFVSREPTDAKGNRQSS